MSHLRVLKQILLLCVICAEISEIIAKDFSEADVIARLTQNANSNQINCQDIGLGDFINHSNEDTFLNSTGQNDGHYCRLRDFQLYPEYLWNFLAGGQCIFWTQRHRLYPFPLFSCNYTATNDIIYEINLTVINGSIVFFNHLNDGHMHLMRTVFRTRTFFDKFIECCQEADYCCSNFMTAENVEKSEDNPCPATWDGWSCFPPARPGTTVNVICPPHSYSAEVPCITHSERFCMTEGGWNQTTNYFPCLAAPIFRSRISFRVNILIAATVFILPALVIFFWLPKKKLRIIWHRNLLLAIAIKNILTIMSNWIILWDDLDPNRNTSQQSILEYSPGGCKFLAYLENLSINFIFSWMLIEAYYLHKTIVRVFSPDPNIIIIYAVVIVCSVIPSTVWALLMATAGMELCWMIDTETWYQWITDGYRLGILIINTLFLFDIIRIFVQKLAQRAKLNQIKSSIKVIVFLILLFGVPLIITSQRGLVNIEKCIHADVYFFVMYSVEALQGIIIAIIFCYLSKEIHKQLRLRWSVLKIHLCGYKFTSDESISKTVLTRDGSSTSRTSKTEQSK